MRYSLDVYDNFHLHGASAPEWNQRYLQLSPGTMRSSLVEATAGGLHVFRKWMSERVIQQGSLPAGKLCFALLAADAGGMPRMQGHELRADRLFVLRAGEEFMLQRPQGMELLAVTFEREDFLGLLDARPWSPEARGLLARPWLQAPACSVRRLRQRLLGMMLWPPAADPHRAAPAALGALYEDLAALFDEAAGPEHAAGSASPGFVVAECHRIVADSGDLPPDIGALCRRLRISRRGLQNSFRQVADTTPLHYLRSLRLNMVRSRLMATRADALSVSQAATDQGFDHLSHFTERYKALFGELPSHTMRRSGEQRPAA
jgi:AraC-like DNA-binding protein